MCYFHDATANKVKVAAWDDCFHDVIVDKVGVAAQDDCFNDGCQLDKLIGVSLATKLHN